VNTKLKALLATALVVTTLGLSACHDGHPGRWSRHHPHGDHSGDNGHDHNHDHSNY
jgi:hypothetical protein